MNGVKKHAHPSQRKLPCGQVTQCIAAIELALSKRLVPSEPISEYSDGSLDVTCCFGHIFHELDPTALRLNERQCGVIRGLLEEHKYLSDICAQMRNEYPPTNRLHYTSTNDIRNLALRLGLPIHLKERKHPSLVIRITDPTCAEAPAEQDDNVSEASAESSDSEDDEDLTPHSDVEREDVGEENEDDEELHIDDSREEDEEHSDGHDLMDDDEQPDETALSTPSPTSAQSSLSNNSETRPPRTRRAPRRFGDD
ncbi:hypothetical protein NECAME_02541 [Necator americanus]|uniref:Uncharacterized protein n=1 Tax=Necator americanus TaxID=51031 RepID=W2TD08_NECAM|nr:hypothetical protein NECAME_02541 [Necator americanus]ETN79718.1 hypothetical protein NECAME_02541 [Necator americanus]